MIRLRPSGADEVLIKRVRDWYEPGPGVFIAPQALFNPALLFTTGVNGTWYDPSDLTTLFQDAAGTTPVTAVEQPVGLMKDKSSRGNHALNPSGNSANFPVLKQDEAGRKYLNFNGNQWLQTNSIDFTYGDKMFVSAGVRKIGTSVSIPIELSANADTTAGTFNIGAPVAADLYYASLRGSSNLSAKQTPATFPSPITSVVQVSYALSQPSATDMSMRVNAVSQTLSVASSSPGPAGAGNFGNYPLYIGARGGSSLWFNGRLYGMVVAGKQASASEITSTETYINQKTGAY